jgi:predicted ATPase/tetratricopeptide (TPR) repeat protein
VTFLFTDIEGSTRRWEADRDTMRVALAAHDEVLRSVIDTHAGWMFKHTGDGVCAAFSSADDAIAAAVAAQRRLELPVRMGIATGTVDLRGDDYFGPALNRAARVMSAGHGGQILVAAATAALAPGQDLVDLGVYRLRDLSGAEHLFQVRADGLRSAFRPLRTLDATPGNLPVMTTSLVGRTREVKEVVELVRAHRLVTLTGVGGVGKTRLALQVAAELTGEFPDGVWFIELAPVVDPGAVPSAVATALGVTRPVGDSIGASVAQALSGRRLLVVLDNCEHVLDETAAVVDAVLAGAPTVWVLATSREGLRAGGEQLWPVPSLDTRAGEVSPAAELFVERAKAVNPLFDQGDAATMAAVAEICSRLDGIALAIELAAARMVAMSPQDLRDRLGDRFRLLSGPRRGLERHQTLRQAVSWSYDLLEDNERILLTHCSVFAGGFDAAAAAHLVDWPDEYSALDGLESLVRKSLVTVDQAGGHARYGMYETIRQFAEEQLGASGSIEAIRDRHATYYADQAEVRWARWDGPRQPETFVWVDAEFANLRAAFQWASRRNDLVTATVVVAHTAMLAFGLENFEPVGWAEQLLPAATDAGIPQLPRLCIAASHCSYTSSPVDGVRYAEQAVALEQDGRYVPFENGWAHYWHATAYLFAGQYNVALAIYSDQAARDGSAQVQGRVGQLFPLGMLGRSDEAIALVDEAIRLARAHGNPWLIANALNSAGHAYQQADPARALDWHHQALAYSLENSPFFVSAAAQAAAPVEMFNGDPRHALDLYDRAIESFYQCGNVLLTTGMISSLADAFRWLQHPDLAAILDGAAARHIQVGSDTGQRPRATLGEATYEGHFATGAAMDLPEAVRFARDHIEAARHELDAITSEP